MEADKLGGYTVKEWRQMIEDKVVADISDEVLEFVKPNIFERKNAQNKEARKESVTEELYYVRNEGFLGNALLWWTKAVTAIPAI
jgi:valyl-tRNA synthetase